MNSKKHRGPNFSTSIFKSLSVTKNLYKRKLITEKLYTFINYETGEIVNLKYNVIHYDEDIYIGQRR